MDYLLSKKEGPNPSVAITGGGERIYGGACLPQMMPARASTNLDYYVPPYPAEVAGRVTCLTEVVPWPYAADTEGIAFDQANLWGVRTVCWRRPDADGAGDKEWWTAVPRTLPAGYTSVGRCGITTLISNHLSGISSDGSVSYSQWNHRTPTGLLWDMSIPLQQYKSRWSPMNLNQQVLTRETGDGYSGNWVWYYNDDVTSVVAWIAAAVDTSHIGFRGGKLTFTIGAHYAGTVPISGSATYEIIAVRVDEYWDRVDADGTEGVVEILTSGSLSWSFTTFADPAVVITHTLPALLPADTGILYNFYIRYAGPIGGPSIPIFGTSHVFKLSPRTDVPLWYFSSMGNDVAPGGYIP